MTLRNKLFLLIITILTFTLLVSGTIYIKNIHDIFKIQVQHDINHDNKILNQFITQTKYNLTQFSTEIAKNEEIKSSLNLISNYENPNDYVKEIYDFEKNNLIEFSNKWIKTNDNFSISIFNKNKELILLNRTINNKKDLGYITYVDNKKVFFKYNDKETSTIPFVTNIENMKLDLFHSNIYKETYFLKYLQAIILDEQIIGYVRISFNLNKKILNNLNQRLGLPLVLKLDENIYILPDSFKYKNMDKLKESSNYTTEQIKLIDSNLPLYGLSVIDKTQVNDKLNTVIINIVFIWILLLFVTFGLSIMFIKKSVLQPIENLKNGIENIKNNHFEKIDINSKDEIAAITKDFNRLSEELSTNISFLNSYKSVMDHGSLVTKSDLSGMITYINDNFTKVTGYEEKEILGRPHSIVRDKETPKSIFENLWKTIQSKKTWKGVLKNRKKNGDYYWVDIVIEPILNEQNEIIEYIAVRHDITELINQRESLSKMAYTDSLTQLGNRLKLTQDIQKNSQNSIAILNIDNFRQVNDFYGHEFGDKLIVQISKIIHSLISQGKSCNLYHLQGDEFVLLDTQFPKEVFEQKVSNILHFIENDNIDIENEQISVKLTAAMSFEKSDVILQTADMALQKAKKQNIDIVVYKEEDSLNKQYENNIKWTKKLKLAIEEDRIVPFFQPIVNNKNEKYEKYESLVRIVETDGKVISPFFFLDIAKQTKYYNTLTKIMLKKSFDYFKDKTNLEFSVNLTVDDILNDELQVYIFELLEQYNIGNRVVFEIVESESIENFQSVIDFIQKIKEHNCKIAIDDFGTGYSNFEYLMKLKADYIKIDGSMIKDIDKNKDARMVVSTIVDFAKKMNIKTIAEFVEDEKILNIVKELDIDYTQGYYYSEPKQTI